MARWRLNAPAGRKPGFTDFSSVKVRMSNPAPARSTTVSAICPITSNSRTLFPATPADAVRASSCNPVATSFRVVCMAGQRATSSDVSARAHPVKASTGMFTRISSTRGKVVGSQGISICTPQLPSNTPSSPPIARMGYISTTLCRTRIPRVAPSAERTAFSRARSSPRARIRFARLAQPMSSTPATAPSRINRGRRANWEISWRNGAIRNETSLFESGYCAANRAATVSISACASATETPGLSRATARW